MLQLEVLAPYNSNVIMSATYIDQFRFMFPVEFVYRLVKGGSSNHMLGNVTNFTSLYEQSMIDSKR